MSELDGISPRELEKFRRKYEDTHTEIKAISALAKSGYAGSSLIKNSPGDKNAGSVKKYKKPIERSCIEKQRKQLVDYLVDGFELRKREILSKKDLPIKDLLNVIVKFMPQKVESEVNANMDFAEMIKSVTLEQKRYKPIDAEDD